MFTALLEAVEHYAESVASKAPQYIAHPATWLNGARWEDEPTSTVRTCTKSLRRARLLILLRQWFDEVVEIIGFFKNDSFLENHVISIRYSSL
jgi:hypothetical protein